MFFSTFEKQLDAKRRIVLPQDFRTEAARSSPDFDGVYCFPSIEEDCIEGGGLALLQRYETAIDSLAPGDPLRSALEFSVFGQMRQLAFDSAGRIVLPEALCSRFGLTDWVAVVGLRKHFQIWSLTAYREQVEQKHGRAHEGWPTVQVVRSAPAAPP